MTALAKKRVFGFVFLIIIIAAGAIIWKLALFNRSPFTNAISKQAAFVIFYPDDQLTGYKIDATTIKYSSEFKVLSFTAQSADNKLVVAEQATPDQFNDIPQYWQAFTDKLNGYKSFDSASGKVALTRPSDLKGGQSAVFNGKGTLMFLHPDHDLSEDNWRKLLNTLKQ